ncbi:MULTISPECIES: envelope stress response membrane protein PspB [Pontibacterium]|jgi:phage shock protein B|nr:envelope stress response membrane protein PspB [Pontibacterium sinense]
MMSSILFFFVPTVIFMGLVAPLWLVLHYLSKSRATKGLSEDDRHTLSSAMAQVERLEERIGTLETILDAEHPQWRDNESDPRYQQSTRR